MTSNRRQTLRRRTLLSGKIDFHNRAVFDCVVRNISAGGAKIACAQQIALPDIFHLSIPQKDERRRARAVWRGREEIGVRFLGDDENIIDFPPPTIPQ